MKFSEFPFLRYVLFFALGILAYPFVGVLYFDKIPVLLLLLFLLYGALVVYGHFRKYYQLKLLLPLLAYLQLILAGLVFSGAKDITRRQTHLTHYGDLEGYMAVVQGMDETKPRSKANTVKITHIQQGQDFVQATGEVIIYHQMEDGLSPGEVIWISGMPDQVEAPRNPEAFDYRRFLSRQQIYHRHFVGKQVERLGKVQHEPINQWVMKLRRQLLRQMDRYLADGHSNQIAKALLLGQKKYLDKEVSEAYVTAGTMHVLAVSGLHVGIVYGFFYLFFKPYQLSRTKRVLYLSLVIILIWGYALLTGMSPSVMRAATMFTLMGLAQMNARSPSIYNALALSALILMLLDPFIIYTVGFQLSYAALLGILLLQPVIQSFWLPRNKILYYIWEITSVSLAAQLATFPISAYYFHVFPSYFLLSNLVAIPGAFLIMAVGLPFLALSAWDWAGEILGKVLDKLIQGVNYLIFTFQDIPGARLEHLYLRTDHLLLIWGIVITVYILIRNRKKRYTYLLIVVLAVGCMLHWGYWWSAKQEHELYVYAVPKGTVLAYGNEGNWWQYASTVADQNLDYQVKPHWGRLSKGERRWLMGGDSDGGEIVFLPDGHNLQVMEGMLELNTLPVQEIYSWEKGSWKKMEYSGRLELGGRAYRIIFQ